MLVLVQFYHSQVIKGLYLQKNNFLGAKQANNLKNFEFKVGLSKLARKVLNGKHYVIFTHNGLGSHLLWFQGDIQCVNKCAKGQVPTTILNSCIKHIKIVSVRHKKSQKSFFVSSYCNQEPFNLPRLYQMDPNASETKTQPFLTCIIEMGGGQDNVRPSRKF